MKTIKTAKPASAAAPTTSSKIAAGQKPAFLDVPLDIPAAPAGAAAVTIGLGPAPILALEAKAAAAKARLDPGFGADAAKMFAIGQILDPYSELRRIVSAEFGGQAVSNSWLKYYEIFHRFDFATQWKRPRVFFNAELPGGSLCAWNHYAKTRGVAYEWNAASWLGPGGGPPAPGEPESRVALEDRHGLYAANRDRWLMDDEWRGDATDLNQIDRWAELVGGQIDLYSHDAGINIGDDFNDQEVLSSRLHLGCAMTGLLVMAPGAAFIAKQFLCAKPATQSLIAGLGRLFGEFHIVKPKTSRARNSEMYLVGLGYRGRDAAEPLIVAIRAHLASGAAADEGVGAVFVEAYVAMRRFQEQAVPRQIEAIGRWVDVAAGGETAKRLKAELSATNAALQRAWIVQNQLRRLDRSDRLPATPR